jgi:hypothetical protein
VRSEKTDVPLEALLTGPVPTVAGSVSSTPRTGIRN